jgi:hypothetical protein
MNSKPRCIAAVLLYYMQIYIEVLRLLICTLVLTIVCYIFSFTAVYIPNATNGCYIYVVLLP